MERFEPRKFITKKAQTLHSFASEKGIIVAVSGGIDSIVCFEIALAATAKSNEKPIPLMLDTGLLRINEVKETEKYFRKQYGIELQKWEVQDRFLLALKGISTPEEKRKTFREVFYKTMGQALRSYSAEVLVQGTILPDVIETQKGIKTHFNVLQEAGIDPQNYGILLFEPIKELTKIRIKMLARSFSIPPQLLKTQPFPGIGFAARITGEITVDRIEKIRAATSIVESELIDSKIFQCFPALFIDRVTGIQNDTAVIGDIIAIRAVESKDSLTAKPFNIPWAKIEKITKRILNEVPGIVRVVYDFTPKPPGTIEFV